MTPPSRQAEVLVIGVCLERVDTIIFMLVGHQKQWQMLKKTFLAKEPSLPLLFFGQESLGKRTLAIEIAKLIYCQAEDFSQRPCFSCQGCANVAKNIHPDFIFVEPQPGSNEIKISQIRELIWRLSLRPSFSAVKTAVLDKAHLMTREAQNCLLKTLEEPEGKTFFVLITEYPQMILETILSRVQKIKFFPVKDEELKDYFLKKKLFPHLPENVLTIAAGRPGVALRLAGAPEELDLQNKLILDFGRIAKENLSSRFQYAKELASSLSEENSMELSEILDIWTRYLRKVLLLKLAVDFSQKEKIFDGFANYSSEQLKNIISKILEASFVLQTTNVNTRLALELLFIEI